MTKINNLQMKSALSADKRVSIKKGFLGLSKSMVYNNTNSTLKGNAPEYRIEDQRVLNALICANQEELEAAAKKVSKLKTVDFGQLKLEVVISEDSQFAAIQLFVTDGFQFNPTADIRTFEGKDVAIIASMF